MLQLLTKQTPRLVVGLQWPSLEIFKNAEVTTLVLGSLSPLYKLPYDALLGLQDTKNAHFVALKYIYIYIYKIHKHTHT